MDSKYDIPFNKDQYGRATYLPSYNVFLGIVNNQSIVKKPIFRTAVVYLSAEWTHYD